VLLHYITLHYKTIYSGQSQELQGPLWRKSHNNVRIWLPKVVNDVEKKSYVWALSRVFFGLPQNWIQIQIYKS